MSKSVDILLCNCDKRKHLSLSIEQKVNLLKKLDRGVSVICLMDEFGVGRTTIYDLKRQKDKLFKFYAESDEQDLMKNRKTLHKSRNEDLDYVLKEWILQRRSKNIALTDQLVIEQAKVFHQEMKVEGNCEYSVGWLHKFKKRHGFKSLQIYHDKKSVDQFDDDETDTSGKEIMSDSLTNEKNLPLEYVSNKKLDNEIISDIDNGSSSIHSTTGSEEEKDLNQDDQDKSEEEKDLNHDDQDKSEDRDNNFDNRIKMPMDEIVKNCEELMDELEHHAFIMEQKSRTVFKIKEKLVQQKLLLMKQMTREEKISQKNAPLSLKNSVPGLLASDAPSQDVGEVKNKWKHLRDSFNRELRRCPSTQTGESTSKWAHYQDMIFIKDGLTPGAAENFTVEFQEGQDSHINSNGDQSFVQIMNIVQQAEDLEDDLQHPPKPKKKKISHPLEEDERTLNSLKVISHPPGEDHRTLNSLNDISHPPEEDHRTLNSLQDLEMRRNDYNDQPFKHSEDYHFLMSLVPSLEKLPARQKLLLKIEIQKLIYEATFGEQFKENNLSSIVQVKAEIVETEPSS